MSRRAAIVVLALVLAPVAARAQAPPNADLVTPPANVLLPNYDSVPVGPNAGLEGSAYVARVADPSAAWLNPAGLAGATASEVSGSSGLFQISNVSPSALPDSGGSVQQLPSLVGFTAANVLRKGFTVGLSILTSSSWTQETNSQLVIDGGTSRERFAYAADSEYQQHVGAASVGFAAGRLRLGGGLAFVFTDIVKNDVISDRLGGATSLRSLIIETRASGSAFQMRPLFGVQFDVSPHVHVGGTIRTPALTLFKGASTTAESLAENGSGSVGASFFDANAAFTYHMPFEFHGGVAYTAARGEIEVDVHAYTPISAYAMIASDQPIVTYTNPGSGLDARGVHPAVWRGDFTVARVGQRRRGRPSAAQLERRLAPALRSGHRLLARRRRRQGLHEIEPIQLVRRHQRHEGAAAIHGGCELPFGVVGRGPHPRSAERPSR